MQQQIVQILGREGCQNLQFQSCIWKSQTGLHLRLATSSLVLCLGLERSVGGQSCRNQQESQFQGWRRRNPLPLVPICSTSTIGLNALEGRKQKHYTQLNICQNMVSVRKQKGNRMQQNQTRIGSYLVLWSSERYQKHLQAPGRNKHTRYLKERSQSDRLTGRQSP